MIGEMLDRPNLFDGTLPMLHALKQRNLSLGVATGKSRRGLDEVLHMVQLKGLFDATRTADEPRSKPHPQMLNELMAELGVADAAIQKALAEFRER